LQPGALSRGQIGGDILSVDRRRSLADSASLPTLDLINAAVKENDVILNLLETMPEVSV
jgi:hypothetical protein